MSLNKSDLYQFVQYTVNAEVIRALLILEGLLRGISIDGKINTIEIAELKNWYQLHEEMLQRQSFHHLASVLKEALQDEYISAEEKADIIWLCSSYTANNVYFDLISSDMQKLHGLLHGIIADNQIELIEVQKLGEWLNKNEHLAGVYPYDELSRLIKIVLADGQLSSEERNMLKVFFSEFVDTEKSLNLDENELDDLRKTIHIGGICAVNPQITFEDKLFSSAGASAKANHSELKAIIESRGGKFKPTVVKDTDYLIIGNKNNPYWAFSFYGRKVEQAVKLRKAGSHILIVHEDDFWAQIEA